MPQLDSNTFIYQYLGIIVLFILVYVTLSYFVLPILLRLMLIRNLFLATRQTLTELINVTTPAYAPAIALNSPTHNEQLINSVSSSVVNLSTNWINLLSSKLNIAVLAPLSSYSNFLHIEASAIDYLILFLIIELHENTNE